MTNKQENYIRVLRELRRVMIENDNWESLQQFIEAVTAGGMAIQRLAEQQDDDCISRQAAIEALQGRK